MAAIIISYRRAEAGWSSAGFVVITTRGGARRSEGAWKDDKKNGYGARFDNSGRVTEQGLYVGGDLKTGS